MKAWHLAAVAAVGSFLVASSANAAIYLTFSPPASDGSISGVFGNNGVSGAGTFTDTFNFAWPAAGSTAGSVTTSATRLHGSIVANTNIDFNWATLNGHPFSLSPHGQFENGDIYIANGAGAQVLLVNFTSGGAGATYAGTLAFTPAPEPASWALMITGFALGGAALRRRRSAPVTA